MQMTYDASDLLARSRASFPDSIAQLLIYGANPLAKEIAYDVIQQQRGYVLHLMTGGWVSTDRMGCQQQLEYVWHQRSWALV